MNQALDLKVNKLPSRTWNWLRMNEAAVSQVFVDGENRYESVVPGSFREKNFEAECGDPEKNGSADGECDTKVCETAEKGRAETSKMALSGEGEADAAVEDGSGFCTGSKDREKEVQNTDFDQIPTGMGADMQKLAESARVSHHVYTTAGTQEAEPLRLDFAYADGARQMNCIDLDIRENSRATVVMDYTAPQEAAGLAVIRTRVSAGKDSELTLVQVERLGEGFDCLNDVGILCDENAQVHVIHLVLGAKNVWQGCQATLAGKNSGFIADIGYLAEKDGHLDMNYVARHTGKRTTSEMDSYGVLKGQAFKLFRGTIDFIKGCARSKGNEKEDVLLLDDTVVNQTIPLILCAEEDVEGNHGATIGQLDEELLFYLESRGMPQEAIYQMMARARIDAVCRKIPDEKTREKLEKYLDGRFQLTEYGAALTEGVQMAQIQKVQISDRMEQETTDTAETAAVVGNQQKISAASDASEKERQ